MFEPAVVEPAVELLAEPAGEGSALEFGIGTGRIALPLAERGVHVRGIDASEAMVSRLRAKPGGDRIDVTIGDFATTRPSELDLMARLAGMNLRERWAGWKREPFTSVSGSHVSVYVKA